MKKGILLCLAAIAVAAVAAFAVITILDGNPTEDKAKENVALRSDINDMFVGYVNINQLVTKGAFDQYLDKNNRKLLATMASSAVADKSLASHISNIANDFEATGLNFTKPAYAYVNENGDCVVVIEVKDVANVDKTLDLLSYIAEQESGEPIHVKRNGKNRIINLDDEAIIGYNNTRFIIASNPSGYIDTDVVTTALKRPLSDLTIFGDSDLAFYVNCDKGINIARTMLEQTKAEYEEWALEDEYFADNVQEIEQVLTMLDTYAPYVKKNANVVVSLTFEPGRVTLKGTTNGFDMSEAEKLMKRTSNKHLHYISDDAAIVANVGINGKKYAELINLVLNNEYFKQSEYNNNEINMIAGIACDAIKSINGDITIALEGLEGEYESYYDSYFEEYYGDVNMESVSASMMVDVDDNYIISNLGQFAGGFLSRKDSNHYYGSLSGLNITLGQDDNVLHAGVNSTYTRKVNSVADADWLPSVKNSLSYVVVDADNLLGYSYIEAANTMIMNDMDAMEKNIYRQFVDLVDYAYTSQMSATEAEIVIALDDEQTNALKQITDIIIPILSSEIMRNM